MVRFLRSVNYALQGITYCFRSEKNFRIQVVIAALTLFMSMICRITASEWLAVLFCSALVLALEMINTTIERLSDTFIQVLHPVIKQVKDIAAGAVCLASVLSMVIGCIIFVPKIKFFIQHLTS